jgi:hypothetical protein
MNNGKPSQRITSSAARPLTPALSPEYGGEGVNPNAPSESVETPHASFRDRQHYAGSPCERRFRTRGPVHAISDRFGEDASSLVALS